MRKRLDRNLTLDQLKEEAESFLRETYADVRGIGITSIATNVRNPQKDTWGIWGTRMVKVWGNAEVKERELDLDKLDSLEPENFEIEEVINTDREDGEAEQDNLQADGSGSVPREVYDSGYRIEAAEGDPEEWLDSLDSHRPVSFQLEVYVSRDGKQIGHRGVLSDKDTGLVHQDGGSLSIEQLKARARGFLKEKCKGGEDSHPEGGHPPWRICLRRIWGRGGIGKRSRAPRYCIFLILGSILKGMEV